MHDIDHGHPHEPPEVPHAHEGPDAPLVDPHSLAVIRQLLGGPTSERDPRRPTSAEETLDRIEQHLARLDWLVGLSRRTVLGDQVARDLLAAWFRSELEPEAPDARLRHDPGEGNPSGWVHPLAEAAGEAPGDLLGINLRAVRELFLGGAYVTSIDRAKQGQVLDLLNAGLDRSLGLVDLVHQYAVRTLQGLEHPSTVPNLLDQLPREKELTRFLLGHPLPSPGPKLPPKLKINPLLECLSVLRNGTVGDGSAFQEMQDALRNAPNLTGLIIGVSPVNVCAGSQVVISADSSDPAKQFPPSQPQGVAVLLDPCGTVADVKTWSPTQITIEVPQLAGSGCVTIRGVVDPHTLGVMQQLEVQAIQQFQGCLDGLGLGRQGVGTFGLKVETFCPPTFCPAGGPNSLVVRHQPEIVSFVARDPSGNTVGSDGVEAGTPVTVSWEVRSDDSAPLQVAMSGSKTLTGLPAKGTLTLSAQDTRTQQSLTLETTNSCGAANRMLTVPVFRRLYPSPTPLSMIVSGSGTLQIRSSCPVTADVTIAIAVRNPDGSTPPRVTVPATATIPAGQDRVTVTVTPSLAGGEAAYIAALRQSQAAAVVGLTAPAHSPASVGVWVEPPSGQSVVVSPTNTDLVAVHMAVLHSGRVLMFSADDADFSHIDKVKTRVWDPETNVVTTPLFPYPTHKNLFCAGHCLLPDGRVLVVGGHSIFLGGAAAKEIHTFDPATNAWTRHGPMAKQRWYPTCVTLQDGRALIASGSEGQGPPSILGGVVHDVEVFDPTNNGFTTFPNVHGDICMYPYMFVLPGGLLFFHSRNVSKLFTPGPGAWSPTNGTWSAEIPMQNSTTRTYPGMAGCVLLPLLPEEGYTVRVLTAGGGGAPESGMSASTVATRTAEILDVDVTKGTGSWRSTNRAGNTMLMTTNRFMSDGVLLPDATVLFVNGAAVGKADHSHVSVGFAELFDPKTETFRPLTTMAVPRHYHGSALLLPDGRVAVAGHTKEWNHPPVEQNRFEVELINPPYLFRGPRPRITGVAFTGSAVGYGSDLTVSTDRPADIARVALVRPGSVTHQLNTDQRYVGLTISHRGAASITVKAPPDAPTAPPGYYLLFLVDGRGVPSLGWSVRLL
jgi:hypothetical protein